MSHSIQPQATICKKYVSTQCEILSPINFAPYISAVGRTLFFSTGWQKMLSAKKAFSKKCQKPVGQCLYAQRKFLTFFIFQKLKTEKYFRGGQ